MDSIKKRFSHTKLKRKWVSNFLRHIVVRMQGRGRGAQMPPCPNTGASSVVRWCSPNHLGTKNEGNFVGGQPARSPVSPTRPDLVGSKLVANPIQSRDWLHFPRGRTIADSDVCCQLQWHIPKRSSLSLVVEDIISGKFLMMPGAPMKCIQKVS